MRRIGLGGVVTVLLALIAGLGVIGFAYANTEVPDPNADFETNTTFVYYRDGESKLGNLAVQNRQSLDYAEMPQSIKDAVVAAENRSFWEDPGLSVPGMARAAWSIATGGEVQGGSTITQQYIKIYYLTSDQTVTRKVKELLLAVKLGREQTKEQVLQGYLNTIYFGRGAYGVQAASRSYFDTDAADLTVPQAAVLASVLNNASIFDPSAAEGNEARLLERYRYVLAGMAEAGTITPAQATEYSAELPEFPEIPTSNRYQGPNGFLMKMVENELAAVGFSEADIYGGGLQVTTTFDQDAQDAAVESARRNTEEAADASGQDAEDLHAALASVQVGTGEVLALYGGPDYIESSRNWATTARPTASTFKTFALAAGLSDRFSLRSTFNGNTFTPPGDSVPIRNEFSYQYGVVNLIKATADSINTAFVDLAGQLEGGPDAVAEAAEAAGVPEGPGWERNNRIPLGVAEASPLDMAGAYATFAGEGERHPNHVVREVTDADGEVLYSAAEETEGERAFDADLAHDVTYALSSVVEEGTGARVQTLGRPVAGKTGTNGVDDDVNSAWFVAYTPQVSTAVMYVAGDEGTSDLDPYARPGDSTFFGGTYPAQTWTDYMEVATEGMAVEQFAPPAYINSDQPAGRPTSYPTRTQRPAPPPARTEEPAPPRTEEPEPSEEPTEEPSEEPTEEPSEEPTQEPTEEPSEEPTQEPTEEPSEEPTQEPTGDPGGDEGGNQSGDQSGDQGSDQGGDEADVASGRGSSRGEAPEAPGAGGSG